MHKSCLCQTSGLIKAREAALHLWTGSAGESWASGCPSLSLPSAFLEDLKWTDSGLLPLSSGICRTAENGCAAVCDSTLAPSPSADSL